MINCIIIYFSSSAGTFPRKGDVRICYPQRTLEIVQFPKYIVNFQENFSNRLKRICSSISLPTWQEAERPLIPKIRKTSQERLYKHITNTCLQMVKKAFFPYRRHQISGSLIGPQEQMQELLENISYLDMVGDFLPGRCYILTDMRLIQAGLRKN